MEAILLGKDGRMADERMFAGGGGVPRSKFKVIQRSDDAHRFTIALAENSGNTAYENPFLDFLKKEGLYQGAMTRVIGTIALFPPRGATLIDDDLYELWSSKLEKESKRIWVMTHPDASSNSSSSSSSSSSSEDDSDNDRQVFQ